MELKANVLYYGDNLDILRRYIPDGSIDLVYLDPPFNSQRSYNILFKESDRWSEAQVKAFEDTWHWAPATERTYLDIVQNAPEKVAKLISALHDALGENDVMAYLVMMAIRLVELHRALKPSGSLYLHCDPTASHYLKLVLDQIFGPANFRNEVVWRRSHPKGHASTRFARNHDVILSFAKDAGHVTWNSSYVPYHPEKVATQYTLQDEAGRPYQLTSLLNPNPDRPNLTYEFKGVTKVWRWTKEKMLGEDAKGRIVVPRGGKGIPRYKRYLDEQEGIPVDDFWAEIDFATGSERLGYPTQKPQELLERIIYASSNEGDIVLDPFCGCGTAVVAAHKLNRRWLGIDITHLAIAVMRYRLESSFPGIQFEVVGEPRDVGGARALARHDRYQFQWWALSLVKAQPLGEKKKGADKGIDGIIRFLDDGGRQARRVIIQVKSGAVHVKDIRELRTVASNDAMGVFITLESPTKEMQVEAISAGFYHSPLWDKDYPKMQILTVEELLSGKKIDMPPTEVPFLKAPRVSKEEKTEQLAMGKDAKRS